jgi:hypothetical protein
VIDCECARALLNRLCGRGHQVVNARGWRTDTLRWGGVGIVYLLLKVCCDPRPTGHMPTDSIIFDSSQSAGRAHLRTCVHEAALIARWLDNQLLTQRALAHLTLGSGQYLRRIAMSAGAIVAHWLHLCACARYCCLHFALDDAWARCESCMRYWNRSMDLLAKSMLFYVKYFIKMSSFSTLFFCTNITWLLWFLRFLTIRSN